MITKFNKWLNDYRVNPYLRTFAILAVFLIGSALIIGLMFLLFNLIGIIFFPLLIIFVSLTVGFIGILDTIKNNDERRQR